jgi:hypothetical protein
VSSIDFGIALRLGAVMKIQLFGALCWLGWEMVWWWLIFIQFVPSTVFVVKLKWGIFSLWFGAVAVRGYRVLAYELLIQHVDYLMLGLEISLLCLRMAWLAND